MYPSPMNRQSSEQDDVAFLLQLEKNCSNDDASFDLNFEFNLELKIEDLIASPTRLCQRVPTPGLFIGFGGRFLRDEHIDQSCIGFNQLCIRFFKRVFRMTDRKIVPLLKEIQMSDAEYVVLKNVMMFSAGFDLPEPESAVARDARRKYDALLAKALRERIHEEKRAIEITGKIMEIVHLVQDFFEKVATNVVSLAIKSLAEAKRRSLEEVRKVLKESIVDLEMYMLQGEKPGYLAFEKKRQVAKELAKIAREGKVRTLDDAFFVADGLVSRITDELPEGN
ncbi:unnamed protein product, partial [Mesorhabditis spiculigera]